MEDPIGQLPEDVISVLFSHLTLKEAGKTSVFSRRWKNLWELTPRFDFDGSETIHQLIREGCKDIESKRSEYIRWVNQVVDNHCGKNLDEFAVVFGLDARHSTHLDNWISFAVKNRVKEIKIDLFPVFFLQGEAVNARYSFMRSAPLLPGIECLTSLDLRCVNITGEMVEHLLLVCPLLEQLCLAYTEDLLNLRVVGSSLKLKCLTILLLRRMESIEISAPNLVSFHCGIPKEMLCELVPRLTNLKHLTIKLTHFSAISNTSDLTRLINSCPFLHKFTLRLTKYVNTKVKSSTDDSCSHQYLKVVEITGFMGRRHQDIKIANYFIRSKGLKKLIIDTRSDDYRRRMLQTDEPEARAKAGKKSACWGSVSGSVN